MIKDKEIPGIFRIHKIKKENFFPSLALANSGVVTQIQILNKLTYYVMKKIILSLLVFSFFVLNSHCLYSQDNKDALSVIYGRKSVRHFTGESVSKDDLDKILKAGMSAPTAMNKQPWSFVVITDRSILDKLNDSLPSAKMLAKAGAAIIVVAIPEKTSSQEFSIIDCSLAGENILLAAESLGLGAIWTACYPDKARMETVRSILGIPADMIPVNVIPIGHPTGEDTPKDKFKTDNIHWDKW